MITISNVIDNYTSSSYNIQQKGRYHTFNSSKNELGAMYLRSRFLERLINKFEKLILWGYENA